VRYHAGVLPALVVGLALSGAAEVAAEDRVHCLWDVVVSRDEIVGDAVCIGCSIRVDGSVQGDAVSILGDLDVAGTVGGEAVASGGAVRLARSASVGEDAVAIGGAVSLEPGARVAGEVESNAYVHLPGQRSVGLRGVAGLAGFDLAVAVVFYAILRRRRTDAMAVFVLSRPWRALLVGAAVGTLGGLLFPAVDAMGRFADTGMTLLVIALGSVAAAGFVGLCSLVGRRVAGRGGLDSVIVGTTILTGLFLVPLVGALASLGVGALALGAAVSAPLAEGSTVSRPPVPAP
jgi:hypothetical protein